MSDIQIRVVNALNKSSKTVFYTVNCLSKAIRLIDLKLTMDQMSKSHYAELAVCAEEAQKIYDHLMTYGDEMPDDLLNEFLETYRRIAATGILNGRRRIEAMKHYGR